MYNVASILSYSLASHCDSEVRLREFGLSVEDITSLYAFVGLDALPGAIFYFERFHALAEFIGLGDLALRDNIAVNLIHCPCIGNVYANSHLLLATCVFVHTGLAIFFCPCAAALLLVLLGEKWLYSCAAPFSFGPLALSPEFLDGPLVARYLKCAIASDIMSRICAVIAGERAGLRQLSGDEIFGLEVQKVGRTGLQLNIEHYGFVACNGSAILKATDIARSCKAPNTRWSTRGGLTDGLQISLDTDRLASRPCSTVNPRLRPSL